MPDLIHLLPDSVANQIAAGEVVQRPSSIVKELLENSIDAGSKTIKLIIKDSGKSFVQVVDDGCGMSETDARMSFERHATSKIFNAKDLFNIHTLGFRGEALASIASVATVELKSKRKEDELGTIIIVEGGELKTHEPTACTSGTSMTVKNLFFNIPVRKNFLKSDIVEYKHIHEEFMHTSLAYPEIKFIMMTDNSEVHHLNEGNLRQRVVGVFGKKYDENLVPVEEKTPIVTIKGFIGKPSHAKKTRGEQYIFVNQRYIRNPYFNHAILGAYENLLPEDSFPFYTLFLEIPTNKIDVNVHPTKTEIKFEEDKAIYSIIKASIKKALSQHHVAPSLDFEQLAFNNNMLKNDPSWQSQQNQKLKFDVGKSETKGDTVLRSKSPNKVSGEDWQELLKVLDTKETEKQKKSTLTDLTKSDVEKLNFTSDQSVQESTRNIFQLHNKYIFSSIHSGIILIHQQYAHQRVLYEEYLRIFKNENAPIQKQLFPEVIELSETDYQIVKELLLDIHSLGFHLEPFGKKAFIISGVPADLKIESSPKFIEKILEEYKNNLGNSDIDTRDNIARSMAINAAVKPGQTLSAEEMSLLIDKLFGCSNPYYSPKGKPVFLTIYQSEIDKKFE